MKRTLGVTLLAACVLAGGCGWIGGDKGVFRDRGDDYRKARAIPPMKMPEGKDSSSIQQIYAIPVERTDALLGEKFEVPRPAPLVGDQTQSVVRIQKLGDEQWILLEGAPGEAWPRVRAFLLGNRIAIEREEAANGLMETSWLAFKSDDNKREKYRFRLEQGVQRNSTEVYVQHMGYTRKEGEDTPPPEWNGTASMDKEREDWMVRQVAGYLADTSDSTSVSLLAQGIGSVNKVYLVRDAAGQPTIDLRLPFERAWASLGRALEKGGFRVRDLNHSTGDYFVTYEPGNTDEDDEEAEKPGMLKRLFGWWGSDDEDEPEVVVGTTYRIEMRNAKEGVTINVRRDDGQQIESSEAEFVIGLIKSNLA